MQIGAPFLPLIDDTYLELSWRFRFNRLFGILWLRLLHVLVALMFRFFVICRFFDSIVMHTSVIILLIVCLLLVFSVLDITLQILVLILFFDFGALSWRFSTGLAVLRAQICTKVVSKYDSVYSLSLS